MKDDNLCACGGHKKPQFQNCYDCHRSAMEKLGRVCPRCSGWKHEEFPTCKKCKPV